MHNLKTVLVAQAIISFCMALMMTGFFAFLDFGPTLEWLVVWKGHFVVAWPVAFCLSILAGRFGFKLAEWLTIAKAA